MILMGCIYMTIAFVVLKLIGVVGFSWWWVFSPWIFGTSGLVLYGAAKEIVLKNKRGKVK